MMNMCLIVLFQDTCVVWLDMLLCEISHLCYMWFLSWMSSWTEVGMLLWLAVFTHVAKSYSPEWFCVNYCIVEFSCVVLMTRLSLFISWFNHHCSFHVKLVEWISNKWISLPILLAFSFNAVVHLPDSPVVSTSHSSCCMNSEYFVWVNVFTVYVTE